MGMAFPKTDSWTGFPEFGSWEGVKIFKKP